MATEAQRLIGISLTKIAQSRAHRGGVSLHKNLLVATVLQKARFIFMEEAYHMVHAGSYCSPSPVRTPLPVQPQQPHVSLHDSEYEQNYDDDVDNLVALTPEEAGISDPISIHESNTNESSLQEFLQPSCIRCDKENVPPTPYHQTSSSELTYLDLDKSPSSVLRERSGQQCETANTGAACLKRRRAVTEWETEEAVLSILPKRSRQSTEATDSDDEGDDCVFLDEAALFSDCVAREAAAAEAVEREQDTSSSEASSAMEIDRITSLVSIFSFGGLTVSASNGNSGDGLGKLSRSVSTPDLCSAQAKESTVDALQQRPLLTMTV